MIRMARSGLCGAVLLAMATTMMVMVMVTAAGTASADTGPKSIKLASLAPEGSSWMKLFHQWGSAVEKRAPGVRFKFYAGGVAGDERDAVRKMKLGQINGAAITAIGLGLIQPQVRVLEIPFFIKGYTELDYVREKLDGEFRKMFEEKGYVLLFWGDVGQVQLFTNAAITDDKDGTALDKLGKMKMWAWSDDPMVKRLFKQVKLNSVPLGVPDVLPALQTGIIDACYGSALSTLALQWNTKVKYVTSMVLGQSVGATVLTKAMWDSLSPEEQKVMREESSKLGPQLLKVIRDDNVRSLAKMKTLGMQEIATPEAVVQRFSAEAKSMAEALDGQLFTKEFRLRVGELIKTCPPDRCKK